MTFGPSLTEPSSGHTYINNSKHNNILCESINYVQRNVADIRTHLSDCQNHHSLPYLNNTISFALENKTLKHINSYIDIILFVKYL